MKPAERTIAFFSAMLLTFGISGLDFEYPAFEYNTKEYILIGAGIIFSVMFLIRRIKAR
jgi:hypothetical protein